MIYNQSFKHFQNAWIWDKLEEFIPLYTPSCLFNLIIFALTRYLLLWIKFNKNQVKSETKSVEIEAVKWIRSFQHFFSQMHWRIIAIKIYENFN